MNRNNGRKIAERLMLLQDFFIKNADKTHAVSMEDKDMGTVLLSYRATHKRTGLLPAASLPDWRMGMPAAKAFRIDASHRVPLQRPASCRLSLPDGSEANLPHETVKSLRRQDKRTVSSSPPVSQKLSG